MTAHLTLEDLVRLVEDLGVGPVRDLGLLDSAAHRPATRLYGQDVYPALPLKAGAVLESIVRNHPLVDDAAYDLVVGLVSGTATLADAAASLTAWSGVTRGTGI